MRERTSRTGTAPRDGFTLIELMMVVCILGVLAALALPALTGYLRQTKTAEVSTNLNNLFKTAAAFYMQEHAQQGLTSSIAINCVVATSPQSPDTPTNFKQRFSAGGGFQTLGFSIGDFVYYSYGITSIAPASTTLCGVSANVTDLYTFFAHGDIDGDLLQSTFMLSTGTDQDGQMFHSRGMYIDHPIE